MTNKPDKGLKNGSCNRTACQQPGASYYNPYTLAYYCAPCAKAINVWLKKDDLQCIEIPEEE